MPSTVAVIEMTSASATIMRRTCLVLAPTARISASSRRRWLIVMPNTLLMMNALTNVVTNANASRPLPKIEMIELMSSAVSSATCSPVTTSVRGGRICLDRGLHGGGIGSVGELEVDRVVRVAGTEHLLRGRRVERRDRGAAEAVGVAEADEPDDLERLGAGVEHDARCRRRPRSRPCRRSPCRSPPRPARRAPRPPSGRRRRCRSVRSRKRRGRARLASDRFAVLVEHLREPGQRPARRSPRLSTAATSSASEAGIGSRTASMLSTVSDDAHLEVDVLR